MTWYKKNMLFEDSMSNVEENTNESDLLDEDPIALDEPNEDEVEREPFGLFHDDKIPFSRLLSDLMVWQMQRSNNGDVNLYMPLLNDHVQMLNAPPMLYMLQWPQVKTCPHVMNGFLGNGPPN
jgi:hypothetical protein